MADSTAVTFSGARPGDALSSFQRQAIRAVYVPRSWYSFALTLEKGVAIQDAGARGYLSAMGAPSLSASGALAIDWRVVAAVPKSATLADASALLDDNASAVGARLVSLAVVPIATVDRSAADRQAAAAGAAGRVPTLGGTLSGAAGAVGGALGSLLWWLVLFVVLGLLGLYLWSLR